MAAVINCHKFGGLSNTNLFSSSPRDQKFKMCFTESEPRCCNDSAPLGDSGENPFSCLFPSSGDAFLIFFGSWPLPPTSKPVAQYFQIAVSMVTPSAFWIKYLYLPVIRIFAIAFRAYSDNPGWSPFLTILNLITLGKSLFSCKVHRFQGLGLWYLLGPISNLTQLKIALTVEQCSHTQLFVGDWWNYRVIISKHPLTRFCIVGSFVGYVLLMNRKNKATFNLWKEFLKIQTLFFRTVVDSQRSWGGSTESSHIPYTHCPVINILH